MRKIHVNDKWWVRIGKATTPSHWIYFALVMVESGHWYGYAAGICLALDIVNTAHGDHHGH